MAPHSSRNLRRPVYITPAQAEVLHRIISRFLAAPEVWITHIGGTKSEWLVLQAAARALEAA